MAKRMLVVALVMNAVARVAAQTEEAAPDASAPAEDATVESSVEATLEQASEPVVDTPAGYTAARVPQPPSHPARQAHDEERAAAVAAPVAVDDPDVELAIAVNGLLNLSGTTTPVLATSADLVFALDPRAWIGLGIAFSYAEQHAGLPDMKIVTSSLSVPVIFQYYFDAPHVGAAVPTMRVQLVPGWAEAPVGIGVPATQLVTGALSLHAGITWMAASWLALRIIGGINGSFGVNVIGPVNIVGNAGVSAVVSAVVRF